MLGDIQPADQSSSALEQESKACCLTKNPDSPQSVVDRACRCRTKTSLQAQESADSELQKALEAGLESSMIEVMADEQTSLDETLSGYHNWFRNIFRNLVGYVLASSARSKPAGLKLAHTLDATSLALDG